MQWAELIHRRRVWIFNGSCLLALFLLTASLLLDMPHLALAAFGVIGILVALLDFRLLFYLLLLVLPLSDEIEITGQLSLYVPTEPITIFLTGIALFYIMLRPELLRGPLWKHPITILLLLHILWALITTIGASHVVVSLKYMAAKIWFSCVFFFLTLYIIRDRRQFRLLFWLLFLPTLGGIVYVMARHASTGFSFDAISAVVRPIYRNHVNYGVWITAMLPLVILARSWFGRQTVMRLFMDLSACFFLVAIYFSYTRGAWVALLLVPVFLLVIRFRMVRAALAGSILTVLLATVFLLQGNRYLDYAPDFNKTIYHEDFGEHMTATFQMEDMSTVERFYRWIAAARMVGDRPLTGVGPGNFVLNYKAYTVSAYSTYISDNEEGSSVHNYFLTMLTEQGVPGLLIFLVWIVVILLYFEKIYHRFTDPEEKRSAMAVACCFLVLLVNNFFSDLLEADKLGPLFLVCTALLVRWDLQSANASTTS